MRLSDGSLDADGYVVVLVVALAFTLSLSPSLLVPRPKAKQTNMSLNFVVTLAVMPLASLLQRHPLQLTTINYLAIRRLE